LPSGLLGLLGVAAPSCRGYDGTRFRTCLAQMEASMRYVLQISILLAAFADSTAFAADPIRLAQVITPGQVQPTPLVPTPLISSQTSTACLVSCDTQDMKCQNAGHV